MSEGVRGEMVQSFAQACVPSSSQHTHAIQDAPVLGGHPLLLEWLMAQSWCASPSQQFWAAEQQLDNKRTPADICITSIAERMELLKLLRWERLFFRAFGPILKGPSAFCTVVSVQGSVLGWKNKNKWTDQTRVFMGVFFTYTTRETQQLTQK